MKTIEFHFDFLSPYAYYARHKLVQIAMHYGVAIDYKPGDLKRLKIAAGNTGPATVQMPHKLAYALTDFERWAKRYGIAAATSPSCFDVRSLNVGTLYAEAQGKAQAYVALGFEKIWTRGGVKQASSELLAAVALESGLDLDGLLEFVASPQAAEAYEAIFQTASSKGIFGVPTMVLDGQMWWGNDRLFMLDEYLAANSTALQGA